MHNFGLGDHKDANSAQYHLGGGVVRTPGLLILSVNAHYALAVQAKFLYP